MSGTALSRTHHHQSEGQLFLGPTNGRESLLCHLNKFWTKTRRPESEYSGAPTTTSTTDPATSSNAVLSTSQMSTPKTTLRNNVNKPIRRQSFGGCNNPLKSGPNSRSSTLTRVNANTDDNYGKDIKNIPKATWKLLTNKIYIVTCLVGIFK